ncbi:MAG TPA: HAMP domain-containing sensor histidine kinase, partial [Actinomycetales bacterium]|nr:HAMP domain-containing sensor histidine kinase [Actinomycetales bacterium]
RLDLPGPADEIKELGDTIDTMLNGLEASFTRQARFITNASHELRTPLTTTRTALEIPLVQGHVPPDLEPAVLRALEANQRSEQLIAALLKLAQVTRVTPAEIQEPVELSALVNQSITEHQDDIASANLSVTTHLPSVTIRPADPTLLTLAIDNLIDNAIRHNQYGGTIQVTTGTAEGCAWVQVANSGATFSAEETARLIEPFNRGHKTRTTGDDTSLGLGLTLVQNIADSIGATLQLTPNEHSGVVARIEFR